MTFLGMDEPLPRKHTELIRREKLGFFGVDVSASLPERILSIALTASLR